MLINHQASYNKRNPNYMSYCNINFSRTLLYIVNTSVVMLVTLSQCYVHTVPIYCCQYLTSSEFLGNNIAYSNNDDFIVLHLIFHEDPLLRLLIFLPVHASQHDPTTPKCSLLSSRNRELNMWGGSWWLAVATCWFCLSCWSSKSAVCCLGTEWCTVSEVCWVCVVDTLTSCPCLAAAATLIRSSVLSIARKRFSRLVVANIST